MISFSNLFNGSIDDFRKYFSTVFLLGILLYFLPSTFFTIISYIVYGVYGVTDSFSALLAGFYEPLIFDLTFGLIIGLFSLLFSITLIRMLVYKKKKKLIEAKELVSESLGYVLPVIGLSIVVTFALIFLYALLIIPGLIMSIFWTFAVYALIHDDKGIIASLKQSMRVVKGDWWKVFGYSFLLGLIFIGISLAIFLLLSIILIPLVLINSVAYAITISIISSFVGIFYAAFGVIFMQKFYVALKKEKKIA